MDWKARARRGTFNGAAFALSLVFAPMLRAQDAALELGCLNAVTRGAARRPVAVCPASQPDVLNLSVNAAVTRIIAELDLDAVDIRFSGCAGGAYSVKEIAEDGSRAYVVTYPAEDVEEFLPPIAHELSHILQAEIAGGIAGVKERPGDEVELGADFTAGILYRELFRETYTINDFQNSLRLIGDYQDRGPDFHGLPSQRTLAFRRGVFLREFSSDYRDAYRDFTENHYGQIVVR